MVCSLVLSSHIISWIYLIAGLLWAVHRCLHQGASFLYRIPICLLRCALAVLPRRFLCLSLHVAIILLTLLIAILFVAILYMALWVHRG